MWVVVLPISGMATVAAVFYVSGIENQNEVHLQKDLRAITVAHKLLIG